MRRNVYKPRSIRRVEKKAKKKIILTSLVIILFIYLALTWGLPALIGSLTVVNKIKPTIKVESIANNEVIAPPVLNIPFDSTNSASIRVSGYASPETKVEIYLDDQLKSSTNTSSDGSFISDSIDLVLGTNNIYGQTVNDKDQKSLPSKTIKLFYSNERPKLEISEPGDGHQIKGGDKKVKVSGKTDSSNQVTINGISTVVASEGDFSREIDINEGDNTITIIATNSVGNATEERRKVNYQP